MVSRNNPAAAPFSAQDAEIIYRYFVAHFPVDAEGDELARYYLATPNALKDFLAAFVKTSVKTIGVEQAERHRAGVARAKQEAEKFAQNLELQNSLPLALVYLASAYALSGSNGDASHYGRRDDETFAYESTMGALGTGVSWKSNHPETKILYPEITAYI